jgi:hypothetical protein
MRRDRVAFGSRADKGEHLVGTLLVALERAVAKHAGENREKVSTWLSQTGVLGCEQLTRVRAEAEPAAA